MRWRWALGSHLPFTSTYAIRYYCRTALCSVRCCVLVWCAPKIESSEFFFFFFFFPILCSFAEMQILSRTHTTTRDQICITCRVWLIFKCNIREYGNRIRIVGSHSHYTKSDKQKKRHVRIVCMPIHSCESIGIAHRPHTKRRSDADAACSCLHTNFFICKRYSACITAPSANVTVTLVESEFVCWSGCLSVCVSVRCESIF